MRTQYLKIVIFFFLISQFLFKSANSQVEIYEELLSLPRIDILPQYKNNSIVRQISSYDKTGGTDDGFSGKYSYLRIENNDLIKPLIS